MSVRSNSPFAVLLPLLMTTLHGSLALAAEKPTDAHLHAYKVWHHATYLKGTAADAGGTNKLLQARTGYFPAFLTSNPAASAKRLPRIL